ncbi:MAG: IclR family transcriptional regulator [Parvibaculales bacterium]
MSQSIKSAERVLKLFEHFAAEQQPATIKQLSEALNMPQSSTSMLVKNLVTLGYLEPRTQDRTYWPTLRLALLGDWMVSGLNLRTPFVNACQAIAETCGEVAFLAMQNGIFSQYVLVLDPALSGSMNIRSGIMRPLTRTSTGICFLSRLHDDEIGRMTRRINVDIMDADFRRTEADVLADVNAMRRDGYFHADGFMEPGIASIAKLVENGSDAMPLAIAVGGPTKNLAAKKERILDAIDSLRETLSAGSAIEPSSNGQSEVFQRMRAFIDE